MLKTFLITGGTLLLLAGCDVRRQDKIAGNNPLMQQKELKDPTTVQLIDSLHDFGTIKEGEVVQFNFRFKNTGTKPLIVDNVGASCGCTVPEKPEAPINPGDTGVIRVKFNSEHHPGHANKMVNVTSNTNPGFPEFALTGEVTPKTEE